MNSGHHLHLQAAADRIALAAAAAGAAENGCAAGGIGAAAAEGQHGDDEHVGNEEH